MNKNLLILSGVGFVLVGIVAYLSVQRYTKSFSPEAVAEYSSDSLAVKVTYCQPAKKKRLIFGREKDNALVPYDKVWRTGANEATVIHFSSDVQLAGTPVPAGTYSLWTIPGPARWQVVINEETGQWGTQYNDGLDVVRVDVPIRIREEARENFSVYFEEQTHGADLILSWDHTEAVVPIRVQ
ncbi:DUF2911 domain-containing protein [Arundinibacter roseus]|uniref:DUF2911 domain-containing protein n=1 Tax=Arundinibacter roseus TaxID=2070510 RepID=A0A4R4K758_9BACT|nr:DUF2911 domain-containing protein [Arundinibacter roseus]TDB63387.1 DUF2911 domain-containing protein [Arundinibacter roseus]